MRLMKIIHFKEPFSETKLKIQKCCIPLFAIYLCMFMVALQLLSLRMFIACARAGPHSHATYRSVPASFPRRPWSLRVLSHYIMVCVVYFSLLETTYAPATSIKTQKIHVTFLVRRFSFRDWKKNRNAACMVFIVRLRRCRPAPSRHASVAPE